jgi:LAO/AO transport system kinase
MSSCAQWVERIAAGDRAAIARAITAIENESGEARELCGLLASVPRRSHVIGLTGPPGAGKSTLAGGLLRELRARGRTVAVLAVDPSSPLSGGALLGDRVRMGEDPSDHGVFIRSSAARGHLGGLARSTRAILGVFDAAGFAAVLLETVGTGQSEVEIAHVAHTRLVVCPPDLGDTVQALKAGIYEIADVFALNKADIPGVERAERALLAMLSMRRPARWRPPLLRTVATSGEGVPALLDAIERHRATLETPPAPSPT